MNWSGRRTAQLLFLMMIGAVVVAGCSSSGGDSHSSDSDPQAPPLKSLPASSSGTLVASKGDGDVRCVGWGESNREAGVAADCDTVYDLMSMTKQFTAAAIMKLQQKGRLDVDDRIARFLPGVPADKRNITIEQLLTHSSGLVDSLGSDYEPMTRDELIAQGLGSELLSKPGAVYRYSNLGYSLLAAIIEEASGIPYENYLAKDLFRPSGMKQTGYVLPDWSEADIATEYSGKGESHGTPLDHPWAEDGPHWNLRGNGGILSTARDMYRWNEALRGNQVLSATSKRELFRPRVREYPDESFYAYGWVTDDRKTPSVLWHNGGNLNSYGEVARTPDGRSFVFWVANQSKDKADGWNLEHSGGKVTAEAMRRFAGFR